MIFLVFITLQAEQVMRQVRKSDNKLNIAKRVMTTLLAVSLIAPICFPLNAQAAGKGKKLTLKAARSLALEESIEYEAAGDKVLAKQAAYESAVKSITLKEKSMKTFRWSPLINFKFPTKPNFSEASEFNYKPTALKYEISVAQHQMQDKIFEIDEKVNNLYCEIVVLQEKIAFNEKRAESYTKGLARNEAKLRIGEAKKADVEKIQKKIETTNTKIANDRRSLEADLKKLSKMVGFDVSTGYSFDKPFVEATIERSMLDSLIQYTEDRDETYFEACVAEVTARAELNVNSGLVRNKYGTDYNIISSYVNTALNGDPINKKAFNKAYKDFLKQIDSYWDGKKRILFFKFPKIWFKGSMDGTRYIEDDPSALQTNVLDYASAVTEKRAAKEELDQSVIDYFNNYISVRNSYKQYIKDVDDADKELKKAEVLNRNGELTFEEYDSQMESYEELQNSMLDSMKLYTTTLYGFDRLTCGGISALLTGTDADMQAAVVGESYPEKKSAEGAYYTLRPIIQSQEFELTVHIPDDFEVDVTDYELWVDGILIDKRTSTDKKLRHLMLTVDGVTEAKIRLYNGEEFIDDCVIDPSEESGPLTITTGYELKRVDPDKIGVYEIAINDTTGLLEIKFTMDMSDIKKFKVFTQDGKVMGSDEPIGIDKPFRHLQLVQQSLPELKLEFYDDSGSLLYKARLDIANSAVLKEVEEE